MTRRADAVFAAARQHAERDGLKFIPRGEIDRAIHMALLNSMHKIDPVFRPGARWVMNPDWLEVLLKMADKDGLTLLYQGATHLLGLPLDVIEDGGPPHLVAPRTWDTVNP